MNVVYVLDKDGRPLMPTTRFGWVNRALDAGKAKAVRTKPFTIRLTYDPKTRETQGIRLGIDPGRTNIGANAVREDGKCLYRHELETRNKEIPKLMAKRKLCRQASRRGERMRRKRLAKRLGTTMKHLLERELPGYGDGVMIVRDIINTEAKFNNRKRKHGWIGPTVRQLLQTHENMVLLVEKILPVTSVSIEANKFDFVKMEDPKIRKWQYGKGPLYGKGTLSNAVKAIQHGKCLLCGNEEIAHVHHLVPKSKGGSDRLGNVAGLCFKCHRALHTDRKVLEKLHKVKAGGNKKYGALSVLNQILERFIAWCGNRFHGNTYLVTGWDTKAFREKHKLQKTHSMDAYAIAAATFEIVTVDTDQPDCFKIKQYRRHDRARIKSQTYRSYYLDGKKVAQNRKPACEATVMENGQVKTTTQKFPALSDWYKIQADTYGEHEANTMLSRLTVQKSYRRYNDPNRHLPGSIFVYRNKRYVLSGQITNGKYYRAVGQGDRNFPAKECSVYGNRGLVYIA